MKSFLKFNYNNKFPVKREQILTLRTPIGPSIRDSKLSDYKKATKTKLKT